MDAVPIGNLLEALILIHLAHLRQESICMPGERERDICYCFFLLSVHTLLILPSLCTACCLPSRRLKAQKKLSLYHDEVCSVTHENWCEIYVWLHACLSLGSRSLYSSTLSACGFDEHQPFPRPDQLTFGRYNVNLPPPGKPKWLVR